MIVEEESTVVTIFLGIDGCTYIIGPMMRSVAGRMLHSTQRASPTLGPSCSD